MNSTLSCRTRIALSCCLLVAVGVVVAPEALGQDNHLPMISAPPPMKFVSRSERTQLSAAHDAKARARATIELAEVRLGRAEQLTAEQRYDAANAELGVYQGLIEDVLSHLTENKKAASKMRDTFKRLELALRAHCSRIEAIRRVTPAEYAIHVKTICECARMARAEALNAFYGETVVREQAASHEEGVSAGGGAGAKEAAPDPVKKQ
ncbi:MAG TPA: hypothetical protein VJT09_19545 [Pyrinomonadaceae bacterium]|nr:hypothetical protein [Pyrinomonadaceae bacterium]